MNKETVKAGIACCYLFVVTPLRWIRGLLPGAPSRLVVLYYHAVPEAHAASFARQMRALRGRAVSLDDHGQLKPGRTYNAVTFDDAFESVRDWGVPAMRESGVPCSIYAPSANLGASPRWDMEAGSRDASEVVMPGEELATIQDELVTIGSHTRTHPRLTSLDDVQLKDELSGSKEDLEEILGKPVTTIACPYGDLNDRVVKACGEAGYERVLSVKPSVERPGSMGHTIGRILTHPTDGPFVFFLKRQGAYAWMRAASALKRSLRGGA